MIYVGIDDTDTLGTRGTNQLAKAMAAAVAGEFFCQRIVRHQLLEDPRVPFTSQNGSASLVFEPHNFSDIASAVSVLTATLKRLMLDDFISGSDPGLCVTATVDTEIIDFAIRCQTQLVKQQTARDIAAKHGLFLKGLGGTEDGVIGALAAVGHAAANDSGRVVQWRHWPDDMSGLQTVEAVRQRDIDVREADSSTCVQTGFVDVGKHLRPNWRAGRCVLFVTPANTTANKCNNWKALKLR